MRELVPGDGPTRAPSAPDEWHEELLGELDAQGVSAPARHEVRPQPSTASIAAHATDQSSPVNARTPALDAPPAEALTVAPTASERRVAPVRFKVQFTADQAYVDLLEQARALLWHRLPSGDLAQLQRFALEALVEKLVCRKYGAGARSGMSGHGSRSTAADSGSDSAPAAEAFDATDSALERSEPPRSNGPSEPDAPSAPARRSNSRHIPAAVRSAVWLRDEARCGSQSEHEQPPDRAQPWGLSHWRHDTGEGASAIGAIPRARL